MLPSLLALITTKKTDVQVWDCDPLVVVGANDEVAYARHTKIEFTPVESESIIAHAVAIPPASDGTRPEIVVISRQYIDMPADGFALSRRQGIILGGTDQYDLPVTWYINGAADHFLTIDHTDDVPYDEETAKLLESELVGEPEKLNLNSVF